MGLSVPYTLVKETDMSDSMHYFFKCIYLYIMCYAAVWFVVWDRCVVLEIVPFKLFLKILYQDLWFSFIFFSEIHQNKLFVLYSL